VFLGKTLSTVLLSTRCIPGKWVPANLMLGVTRDGLASYPGGSKDIPTTLCHRNRDMLQPELDHLAPMQNFPTYARVADIN